MQIGGDKAFGLGLANFIQHIGDDDIGAFGDKAFGTAQANATGGASDDGGFVLEFHA
jgi:hypothetical protein